MMEDASSSSPGLQTRWGSAHQKQAGKIPGGIVATNEKEFGSPESSSLNLGGSQWLDSHHWRCPLMIVRRYELRQIIVALVSGRRRFLTV